MTVPSFDYFEKYNKLFEGEALVQGEGRAEFVILKDGKAQTVEVDFADDGFGKIKLLST